jgi:hypothetical protein
VDSAQAKTVFYCKYGQLMKAINNPGSSAYTCDIFWPEVCWDHSNTMPPSIGGVLGTYNSGNRYHYWEYDYDGYYHDWYFWCTGGYTAWSY